MSSNAHTVTKGGSTLAKHLYIIDTCVLLHDPLAIYKFAENDIYIPLAVIDDLDDIKTRKDNVAWSARETFRQLENFTLIGHISKNTEIDSIDEDFIVDLKIELDDEFNTDIEKIEIETE